MTEKRDVTARGLSKAATLREWLDEDPGDHNYFVVVPFTTAEGALWGAGHVDSMFECQVIGVAAVDLETPLVTEVESV